MPPRKFYPDYCYEIVEYEERGVKRYQKFALTDKMREYDREHDRQTIATIRKKQKDTEGKKKITKKRGRKSKTE